MHLDNRTPIWQGDTATTDLSLIHISEPLIAEIQLPNRVPGFDRNCFAQELHRVKARHLAQLLHGGVVHHGRFVVIHFLELLP